MTVIVDLYLWVVYLLMEMVVFAPIREVALPGGKTEVEDADDAETATREAREEIGLDPSLVNVVTVLEPFLSKVHIYI